MIINKLKYKSNIDIYKKYIEFIPALDYKKNYDRYNCKKCGKSFYLEHHAIVHIEKYHYNNIINKPHEIEKGIYKSIKKHPLKPWEDPDSLFCDTEFLEMSVSAGGMGINVRKGIECKDDL